MHLQSFMALVRRQQWEGPVAVLVERSLGDGRLLWGADRASGLNGVWLPEALERKSPEAGQEWAWMWVFPAKRLARDPRRGVERRHHARETAVQRADQSQRDLEGVETRLEAARLHSAQGFEAGQFSYSLTLDVISARLAMRGTGARILTPPTAPTHGQIETN